MTTWQDIPGWCDFESLYRAQVEAASDGAHFVEIGTWVGKSACLMGQLIRESGKRIRFDAIDHDRGSPELAKELRAISDGGSTIFNELLRNIIACGVEDFVHPIRADSVSAAHAYADGSVDFVFIDGNHEEAAVGADVAAWLPKVKAGGVIAGHDFDLPSVGRAVCRHFVPLVSGRCWVYAP